jgi:hypothetical protein
MVPALTNQKSGLSFVPFRTTSAIDELNPLEYHGNGGFQCHHVPLPSPRPDRWGVQSGERRLPPTSLSTGQVLQWVAITFMSGAVK